MSKFRKVTAVLLSVVMFVCMFGVQASAANLFKDSVKLNPLETVSSSFKKGTEEIYKVNISKPGKITFYCSDHDNLKIGLLDSYGSSVVSTDYMSNYENETFDIGKKGTYYIRMQKTYKNSGSYYTNFYYGFKPYETPSVSIAVNAKVGDALDFYSTVENYSGKITWKSTDSSVASVDKGKVTAKKKGTAKIRAYMDNGDYAEITVKVKAK